MIIILSGGRGDEGVYILLCIPPYNLNFLYFKTKFVFHGTSDFRDSTVVNVQSLF